MESTDILGYIGTVFLSLLYMPQVYQVYKLRQCKEISVFFLILQNIVAFIWISYGILINSYPIIVANVIVEICTILLVIAKIQFNSI